jgi:hypothetical protein
MRDERSVFSHIARVASRSVALVNLVDFCGPIPTGVDSSAPKLTLVQRTTKL